MTLQHCHAHDGGTPIHEAPESSVGELIEGEASHGRGFLSGDANDSIRGPTWYLAYSSTGAP